ncbi:hypothetical protein LEMLEM_LOCUS449, partial [Lemmus lemmus]
MFAEDASVALLVMWPLWTPLRMTRMKYEDGDLRESMRKRWPPLPPPPLSIPRKVTWNLLGQ